VVKVNASGWHFDSNPPVLFRRYPNLKPLPDSQPSGNAKTLASYANLKTDRDKNLFIAYAVTAPLPHAGRPILSASGAMGSGKTPVARVLRRSLDPTALEAVRLDARDFLQKASHAYFVMLDNQNTIPESAADTLCRLVAGEADSKRRLYTDDEDVIVELKRGATQRHQRTYRPRRCARPVPRGGVGAHPGRRSAEPKKNSGSASRQSILDYSALSSACSLGQ